MLISSENVNHLLENLWSEGTIMFSLVEKTEQFSNLHSYQQYMRVSVTLHMHMYYFIASTFWVLVILIHLISAVVLFAFPND